MIWVLVVLLIAVLLFLFLIFPSRPSAAARAPFEGRAFAHRGLYNRENQSSVPENSMEAFRRAVASGYGAELDVQMTLDGKVVVFHDDSLRRVCGQEGRICDYTLEELEQFPLFSSEERIPLFSEVLAVFAGQQPLIVELKSVPEPGPLCDAVRKMLAAYPGPACVESFDPGIVRYFRKQDPSRLRGQLAEAARASGLSRGKAFVLSRLLLNFRARPQFIAYGLGKKPAAVRLCEALGAMKVCWTAREENLHDRRMEENDAVIFEGYLPEPFAKNRKNTEKPAM